MYITKSKRRFKNIHHPFVFVYFVVFIEFFSVLEKLMRLHVSACIDQYLILTRDFCILFQRGGDGVYQRWVVVQVIEMRLGELWGRTRVVVVRAADDRPVA